MIVHLLTAMISPGTLHLTKATELFCIVRDKVTVIGSLPARTRGAGRHYGTGAPEYDDDAYDGGECLAGQGRAYAGAPSRVSPRCDSGYMGSY